MYHNNKNQIVNLFDINISNITLNDAVNLIDKRIKEKHKTSIYFINADCINLAYKNDIYKKILENNGINFGDGIGIKIASRLFNMPLIDNVNGTDLLPLLCETANENEYKIYLLGAKPGVADLMKTQLEKKYKNIKIVGIHHGYFDFIKDSSKIISDINNSNSDILLVAFGAPKQEMWIDQYFDKINCTIQMGVGGLFDFYSDNIPRAPKWMRNIGLEWLFRLLQEPTRLWKRYLIGNPLFLLRLLIYKIKVKINI